MFSQSVSSACDPGMVSSNRNTQEYDPTDYEQVVVVGVIRQEKLKFLPVLTQQQAVIGNRCSQNSQSLDRAITRESQTHDVDVCGVGRLIIW